MPDLMIEAVILAAVVLVVGWFAGRPRRPAPSVSTDEPPDNAILVDGSNVMYWGGAPSGLVLTRVIGTLKAKGYNPVVVFDASVGYRLENRYLNGSQMARIVGLPPAHVYVVQKGVVADEVILDLAQEHRLRVVSNDRYRDWRVQFPGIARKGALIQGEWKEGNVVWRGKGF